jgi:hypothetical protein
MDNLIFINIPIAAHRGNMLIFRIPRNALDKTLVVRNQTRRLSFVDVPKYGGVIDGSADYIITERTPTDVIYILEMTPQELREHFKYQSA